MRSVFCLSSGLHSEIRKRNSSRTHGNPYGAGADEDSAKSCKVMVSLRLNINADALTTFRDRRESHAHRIYEILALLLLERYGGRLQFDVFHTVAIILDVRIVVHAALLLQLRLRLRFDHQQRGRLCAGCRIRFVCWSRC